MAGSVRGVVYRFPHTTFFRTRAYCPALPFEAVAMDSAPLLHCVRAIKVALSIHLNCTLAN